MLYNKGMERLDREIDIIEMVKKFRKLDVIVKLLLRNDQQLLLDLKNSNYISSDEESENYVLGLSKKKVLKKHKLLQRYIDNIKSKELNTQDEKLLKILGFHDVLDMLSQPVQLNKINSNWGEFYHPIFGKNISPKKGKGSLKKGSMSFQNNRGEEGKLDKRVKFSQASSTGSEGYKTNNVYRSKKNQERRKMKKIQHGFTPEDEKILDIQDNRFFNEIKIVKENSRNSRNSRKSRINQLLKHKFLENNNSLSKRSNLAKRNENRKDLKRINIVNQNNSTMLEFDKINNQMEKILKSDNVSVNSPDSSVKKIRGGFCSNPNVTKPPLPDGYSPSINNSKKFKPDDEDFLNAESEF